MADVQYVTLYLDGITPVQAIVGSSLYQLYLAAGASLYQTHTGIGAPISGLDPTDPFPQYAKDSELAESLAAVIGIPNSDTAREQYIPSRLSATAQQTFLTVISAPTDGTSARPAIQAALNAAAGRPTFLPPGDYTLDGSLTGNAVDLRLAPGARILQTVNLPAIEFTGTGSGSSRGLQAPAAAGQNIVSCNTAGLAAGGWILLRHPDDFPGTTAGSNYGELHRIRQIDGTTQLRTVDNLDFAYPATTGSVVGFGMAKGIRITGGEFVNAAGAVMDDPMIRLTACEGPAVDTTITGAGGPGITVSACALFDVKARVRDSIDDEANGNFGYGVETFGASCHGRVHVDMVGGRHAFTTTSGATTSGIPRHITVTGRAEGTTNTAWDTHAEGYNITFDGVVAVGCRNGAIKHRAPQSRVISPVVHNCLGIGVRFAPTATGGRLDGGDLRGVRYLSAGSPGMGVQIEADDVTVTGDPLIECDDQGVSVADGADNARVLSGTIRAGRRSNAPTSIGVEFLGTSSGHRIGRDVIVEEGATRYAIPTGVTGVNHRRAQRRLDLEILGAAYSHVGFDTIQNSSTSWMNTRRLSSGTQNDEVVFVEYLEAGTWQLDSFHDTSTTRGIYTVSIADVNGAAVGTYADLGTFDGYAGTGARAVNSLAVTVARDGLKAIRYRMATKNGSSTTFHGSISKAVLIRTA